MAATLILATPPTPRQLEFLRVHILRQKKKAQACSLTKERWDKSKQSHSRSKKLQDEEITLNGESQLDHVSHQTDRGEMIKESEIESPGDLDIQIEAHVKRLESLREEKHRLFQQLKMVLHEEDERKRIKAEEQKVELDKTMSDMVSHLDPRLGQIAVGLKRPLPTSSPLPLSVNQGPPVKKIHRAPLLPTPDATTGSAGSSGNGGVFRQLSGEGYQSSSRQHYLSGTQISVGQQAPFPDQRGPHDSIMIPQPQAPGIVQHPSAPVYSGTQGHPYQYASAPSQYGTMPAVQPSANQTSQLHYQQIPRFIHPHEVSLQGQYMPSYGHPNQVQQSHEKPGIQGQSHFIAQDPRHQKVMDHHRLMTSLQSPNQLGKQVILESPFSTK